MKRIAILGILILVFLAFTLTGVAVRLSEEGKSSVAEELDYEASRGQGFQIEGSGVGYRASAIDTKRREVIAYENLDLPIRRILIGGQEFSVVVVREAEERAAGLSNVTNMGYYQGMLFEFDEPALYGFWMIDMLFSLDIIWLAEDGRVVHIEQSLSPETYPTVFRPGEPASYVIELNAGVVKDIGLEVGQYVPIKGIETIVE